MRSSFNKGNAPLFKLSYNDKISYLFGSCHCISIDRLSLHGPFSQKEDDFIIDFLRDRKTLISEAGNLFSNSEYNLDTTSHDRELMIQELRNNDKLRHYTDIINEPDFYRRFVKYHQINYNTNNTYKKRSYWPTLTSLMKNDKIYESLNDVLEFTHFRSINDINMMYLAAHIYTTCQLNGMDTQLSHYYAICGKPIYKLDIMIDKRSITSLRTSIRLMFIVSFILSKINKTDIVNEFNMLDSEIIDKYLYGSWNDKLFIGSSDKHLVVERNKKWLPAMIRYHNETDDPIFIVGAGHLNGEHGLIKLLKDNYFKIDIFNTKERKFISFV